MNRSDLQAWLDRYVEAWRANDATAIGALFTDDAVYRYRPYRDDALRGREAIVAGWLEEGEDPRGWEARYEAYAMDGDRGVATGTTTYHATATESETTYHNVFLLRFAPDGSCAEFTELFMEQKPSE